MKEKIKTISIQVSNFTRFIFQFLYNLEKEKVNYKNKQTVISMARIM